jgi:hypothetical protein
MTDDRWQEISDKIRASFPDHEHEKESVLDGKGTREAFVFSGPMGRMKIERRVQPKVVGERGMQAKRIGAESTIEKVYSEDETVDFLSIFTWNDAQQDWVEAKDDSLVSNL